MSLEIENKNNKAKIINYSKDLGFSEVKVALFQKLDTETKNYNSWIANGFNSTMKWMENNIDKREDVSIIIENAKSVISLAYSYNTNYEYDNNSKNGKISSYAWGTDYHEIIPKKLKLLTNYINSLEENTNSRAYCDTGPVLDKQWALKSGIGWQGKNSLILNRKLGSYFFIANIITTLELEEDKPVRDYCGKCRKCIDACSTDAIIDDKIVDSNKCLSYWTIESKEESFPVDIQNNLNGWLFGCDDCQIVCPWNNSRVPITQELLFNPRGDNNDEIELIPDKILEMDIDQYRERFRKSPLKRTKIDGIKRNAKAVLKFYSQP